MQTFTGIIEGLRDTGPIAVPVTITAPSIEMAQETLGELMRSPDDLYRLWPMHDWDSIDPISCFVIITSDLPTINAQESKE
jgi:hypothetical protein